MDYKEFLDRNGLEQIELFEVGGSNHMSLSSKLYDRSGVEEGPEKKFLLRVPQKVMEEFKELSDLLNQSLNETLVTLMRIALEDSQNDPRIQELKKKVQSKS